MTRQEIRIGITLGDCAGIGPEIVDLALKSGRIPGDAEYQIIGSYPRCSLGQPTKETARAAAEALEEVVTMAKRGMIDAVVTGPIHKARMYRAGLKFPGQTEFFAERCGLKNFAMCLTSEKLTVALVTTHIPLREVPRILQQSEIVRVGLLLSEFLQSRSIRANTTGLAGDVHQNHGKQPRIAVAGLNPGSAWERPHAGFASGHDHRCG